MKFKSDIEIQAGVEAGGSTGSNGQVLSSTGSGVAWIDQEGITVGEAEIAKSLQVTVKNVSGGELTKGTVVHTAPTASPPSGNVIEVIAADYDDTTKMPAVGILKETIANEAEGEAVMTGTLSGIATDAFSIGDELYVGADGALTNVKPQTAGQLIQKIAVCVKSHASNGLIKIFGAGRSNDVPLPLYIDNANQRLGIGTDNPGAKLHVDGDVLIKSGEYISWGTVGATSIEGSTVSNKLQFRTNSSDRMIINSLGNVGIGTNSPAHLLDLYKSTSTTSSTTGTTLQRLWNYVGADLNQQKTFIDFVFQDDNSNEYPQVRIGAEVGQNSDSNTQAKEGSGAFVVYTNNATGVGPGSPTGLAERFRVDYAGNVGIGTTSPSQKLEVNGAVLAGDYRGSANIYLTSPDSWIFRSTGGSERMRITSSGNVGIGTTNPSQKLHVAGNMRLQNQLYDSTNSTGSNGQVLTKTSGGTIWADNKGLTPITPGGITATIVGETIEIAFNQSTTSNIDYYQVWSSDDGGDYGIIGQIAPADFSATMTVVDTTFVTGGTMSYRVYAVKAGVYSPAGTVSKAYTVSALDVTNMTVVNLNTAYYVQYEKPISRFIDHIEIWMDSQTTQAALNRSNATLVYSGQNTSYMRSVGTSSNFHQFWVEVVTS